MPTTGAFTLVDELSLSQPTYRAGVIKTLVEQVAMQDRVPYTTTGSKTVNSRFLSNIPSVQLRFLNEAVGLRKAEFSEMTETLTIIENDVDIDPVFLDESTHVQNIELAQTENIIASIGYKINDMFVNADPTVDPREPLGLKYRLTNDTRFNGQTVNSSGDTTKSDFRAGTATDAEILHVLHKIDTAWYLLNNGNALPNTVMIGNQQIALAMRANLRQIKMYDTTRDQFDREFTMYSGMPLIDIGYDDAGAIDGTPAAVQADGNQIIGNDNDAPTGNGANAYTATSPLYFVRFGDNYCTGLQQTPLKVDPIGKTDVSPHFMRTNIRWVMSPLAVFQKRAIARLVGLDVT